jgi:hypothetical protein
MAFKNFINKNHRFKKDSLNVFKYFKDDYVFFKDLFESDFCFDDLSGMSFSFERELVSFDDQGTSMLRQNYFLFPDFEDKESKVLFRDFLKGFFDYSNTDSNKLFFDKLLRVDYHYKLCLELKKKKGFFGTKGVEGVEQRVNDLVVYFNEFNKGNILDFSSFKPDEKIYLLYGDDLSSIRKHNKKYNI